MVPQNMSTFSMAKTGTNKLCKISPEATMWQDKSRECKGTCKYWESKHKELMPMKSRKSSNLQIIKKHMAQKAIHNYRMHVFPPWSQI